MQEGRMKGQAFITLQNTSQARLALKETNGYILKDKPMVVQFARDAKSYVDNMMPMAKPTLRKEKDTVMQKFLEKL